MRRMLVTLMTIPFIATACGSSSNSPAPAASNTAPTVAPPSVDVCSLVTAEEMSKIVGEAVTSQPKTLQTGIPACGYKANSRNPVPGVTIAIHKPDGKTTYQSAQSMYKTSRGRSDVSGIGEQAFDSGDGTFYALKGDTCLDIVLAQNPDLRLEQFKKIATTAMGRLN